MIVWALFGTIILAEVWSSDCISVCVRIAVPLLKRMSASFTEGALASILRLCFANHGWMTFGSSLCVSCKHKMSMEWVLIKLCAFGKELHMLLTFIDANVIVLLFCVLFRCEAAIVITIKRRKKSEVIMRKMIIISLG